MVSRVHTEEEFEAKILKQFDVTARKMPLLTREEEQELIAAYQDPRDFLYKAARYKFGWLPPDAWNSPEEKAVVKAILRKDSPHFNKKAKEAFDKLILSNLRLIKRFSSGMKGGTLGAYDLFIEGVLGLIHAIDKFDRHKRNKSGKPLKFSTYAVWWIRQYVQRAIQDKGRTIRIPIHVHDQINKIGKVYAQLATESFDSPPPDSKKLAEHTGMSREVVEVLGLYKHENYMSSLDAWANEEESATVEQYVPGDEAYQPEVSAESAQNKDYLYQLLESLPEDDRKFMMIYHGLLDNVQRTPREMASAMGIKKEEVLKRAASCLEKLKGLANRECVNLV